MKSRNIHAMQSCRSGKLTEHVAKHKWYFSPRPLPHGKQAKSEGYLLCGRGICMLGASPLTYPLIFAQ